MPEYRTSLALSRCQLGQLLKDVQRPQESEAAYQDAIADLQKVSQLPAGQSPEARRALPSNTVTWAGCCGTRTVIRRQ